MASLQGLCLPGFEAERRSVQLLRTDCNSCGFRGLDGEPLSERACNLFLRDALPGLSASVRYVDPDDLPDDDRSGERVLANLPEIMSGDDNWDFPFWTGNARTMLPCPQLKLGSA
uniref:Uncharacterized protein n=1 Tax=Prymnesium polylepis TaxID=72548 RepID=A0A7S4IW50_9EUKA